MYKDDPFRTRFEYTDYLQLPLAYRPSTRRILFVGLGGGSAPKRMWRDFPATQIDAVELDPEVVDVAYRVFELPARPAPAGRGRGRPPLPRANDGPWDVIVIDAFYSDSIPFHLATREFLELARSRLAPGGVVVDEHDRRGPRRATRASSARCCARTGPSSRPWRSTRSSSDGERDLTGIRNVILVAGDGAAPSKEFLQERWAELRQQRAGRARPRPRRSATGSTRRSRRRTCRC